MGQLRFDTSNLSLRLFDHLITDLSRFGEVRDVPSQVALAALQELGFREVARVYSIGDADVRHFAHKQHPGRTFSRSQST